MRSWIFGAVLVASVGSAAACNVELLSVTDWQSAYSEGSRPYEETSFSLQWAGNPIKIIDAQVVVTDVLGDEVSRYTIPKTAEFSDDGSFQFDGRYVSFRAPDDLPNFEKDSVIVSTCVRAVQYADGTVEKFD